MTKLVEQVARKLAWAAADRAEIRDAGFFRLRWPAGVSEYVDARWREYEADAAIAIDAVLEHEKGPAPI